MKPEVESIRKHLKKKLSPSRYEHTLGVSYTCIALAMRYGCDLEQAEMAGLLHDCAKRYDDTAIIEKCDRLEIPLTEGERMAPPVVHAKLGAWMAEHKYHIYDPEILSAIACHTTGKPDMQMLDKILYVADYIEPRRRQLPKLPELRRLAFIDLDEALYQILDGTLSYLKQIGAPVDAMTEKAWQYYRALRENASAAEERNSRNDECSKTDTDMSKNHMNDEIKEEYSQYAGCKGTDKTRRKGFGGKKRRRHPNH